MDLLFSLPHAWPEVRRGSERLVDDLGRALAGRGHRVTVVSGTTGGFSSTRMGGVHSVQVPFGRSAILGMSQLESGAARGLGAGLLRRGRLCHAFYPSDAYGLLLSSRVRPRPVVLSWLGTPDREWWEAHLPRVHRWFLRTLQEAAAVTVMTDSAARMMEEQYGVRPGVLAPGLFVADFARARVPGGPPTVLCADAVDDPRKRVDVLVAAFATVARDLRDLRLLMVGDGNPSRALEAIATLPPDLRRRAQWRRSSDVAADCAEATVGVLTGEREAFGLVTLEFLAAGIPAVVPHTAGSREVVDGTTGAVYAEGDEESLAAAVRAALALAAHRHTQQACREQAMASDWSVRVADYERLYERIT